MLQVHKGDKKIRYKSTVQKKKFTDIQWARNGYSQKNLTKNVSLSSARLFVLAVETIIFIKYLTFNLP